MARPVLAFATATLLPVPFMVMGAFYGGIWVLFAIVALTFVTYFLDHLFDFTLRSTTVTSTVYLALMLSNILAILHFFLLAIAVWALSSNGSLIGAEKAGVFLSFGLYFGQISNSNAHELIHRPDHLGFNLGKWVFISLLFGHHTTAHRLIHHRFVGSVHDPNSAQLGESFYRFLPRAWFGSFQAGFEIDREMLRRSGKSQFAHPYISYILGAFGFLFIAAMVGGFGGCIALLALAFYAQVQLMLSDYVQHYGLSRAMYENGKLEPLAAHHSWNAPHWYSSLMMLHAPRHSDHHENPAKPFPSLSLPQPQGAPTLPRSMPIMALLALFPRYWRRKMDPLVTHWQDTTKSASPTA